MDDTSRNEQTHDDILQYDDFLQGNESSVILLKDGSLLVFFRMDGVDYEGLSDEQKEELSRCVRSALEQLPNEGAGFLLSNLLIRDASKPVHLASAPDVPPFIQFIHEKKQNFFNEFVSKSFSDRILCSLRYYPAEREETPLRDLIQENTNRLVNTDQLQSEAAHLERGFISLSHGLARFGVHQLTREESFYELYKLANFSEPPAYRPDLSLNEQLADSSIQFCGGDEYLVVNDTEYISVIGIKELPPTSFPLYLRRFSELGFPLVMRQAIGFADKEKLFKEQNRTVPIARMLSRLDSINRKIVEDIKGFQARIENNKELPVYWYFSVLALAGDKKTLRVRRAEIIGLLNEIGFKCFAEKNYLPTSFLSMLPGHDRFYQRQQLMLTAHAGDFLSTYVLHSGDSNPVDCFQDRSLGVFTYNPFICGERTHCRAICGSTSDGKNFFAVKDLISCLVVNPMVCVVDLSASYSDLFELLKEEMPVDTAIMRVSREDSNFAFNPFLLTDPYSGASEEQIEFCMGLLKIMAGSEFHDDESKDVMRKGLEAFFVACGILLRNCKKEDVKPIQPLSLLSEIIETKLQHPELASALRRWTAGRRGELFNSGYDTVQRARYCYFDLCGMEGEPELATAIVYMIFSKVYGDIADESLRAVQKRLALDEAHRYITDPVLSDWIQRLTNADRQGNFMMDLITESVADIQSDVILANLKQAFFFHDQNDIEAPFEKLHLAAHDVELYKQLNPSNHEVLYWSYGGLCRILRSVSDPLTYWLATTDADERDMKRRMKERFGNNRDSLEELVRVTADCQTVKERLSKLQIYFKKPHGAL